MLFDFLTSLPNLNFCTCWDSRTTDAEEGFEIHCLSKNALIQAKRQAGRIQDLADLDEIRRADERRGESQD